MQANSVTTQRDSGPMTNLNRRLASIADGQLGIVSRGQARAVGGSNGQLRRRVQSGVLDQTSTNTYRLIGAPTGVRAELKSLVLDIGGEVWASGRTAAALHGFDGFQLRAPFDVTIMRDRNVHRTGHRVHTTNRLELIDKAVVDGINVLGAVRTLVDLARTCSVEELVIAIDSGLRDGKFNDSLLQRRVFALASKGRAGVPKLLDAMHTLDFGRGGHSWLEREFLRLIVEAGLPRPDTQQVLARAQDRVVRVDFRFPGTNVVVEVLGFRYHRSTQQISRDAARMNALTSAGFRVYQYSYATVTDHSASMLAELGRALTS